MYHMDGTMTTFSNIYDCISVEILVKVVGGTELPVGKGSVSYGLGADFSLPHCLVRGGQVSEEPSRGASSWYNAQETYPEVALLVVFFSPFGIWSAHAQMPVGSKTYHAVEQNATTF